MPDANQDASKTLYLHIGRPKTGTSALQAFLSANENELARHDIVYPKARTHNRAASGQTTAGNGASISLYLEDKNTHAHKDQWEAFVEHLGSWKGAVVVSSERFSGRAKEQLPKLMEKANEFGRPTKVIVYLRPQEELLASAYSEMIKRHQYTGEISDFFEADHSRFQYLPFMRMLETVAGKENLLVRPYAKDAFLNGSLFDDFLNLIGVHDSEAFVSPEKFVNRSLSQLEGELLRKLNALEVDVDALVEMLEQYPKSASSEPLKVTPELAERVRQTYEEENATIAEQYFEGKDWLSRPANAGEVEAPNISPEVLMLAVMAADLAKKHKEQERYLTRLSRQLGNFEKWRERRKDKSGEGAAKPGKRAAPASKK